ncbi:MAG: hypothetical protein FWB98_01945 [Defluviitaleaceae bacterium]|nr:hypothetical protein [Defluviitaleaceae bacterium]
MQILKNFMEKKGKKGVQNLVVMLIAGVVLLLISAYFASTRGDGESGELRVESLEFEAPVVTSTLSQESYIAQQMEEILSLVAGAGQVRVMLTLGSSASVYAQNTQINLAITTEEDGEGGVRNIDTETSSHTYVMVRQGDGSERPLRIQELRPNIEGVIIVAEGAGDVVVRDALVRAAHTVLGIAVHRVQVFQMQQ